jgi:hypothetical protein
MQLPEPIKEPESGSNFQRLAIGVGTLVVVILTVLVAIFLAVQEQPPVETPVAVATPSPTLPANLLAPASPTATATLPPATPPETPTSPPEVTEEATRPAPTGTPTLPPPTFTFTPPPPTLTQGPPTLAPACPPPAGWVQYRVEVGDTFASLANRTGTTPLDLQQANCVTSATLQAGELIYLPGTPAAPVATSTARPDPNPTSTGVRIVPRVDSISPSRLDEGFTTPITITVFGDNFAVREAGFKVELKGSQGIIPLTLPSRPSVSETSFEAIVPANLPAGSYDLVVTNASDRAAVRTGALIVASPPTVFFGAQDFSVNENGGEAIITVRISQSPSSGSVSVDFQTADGTAVAGTDYQATAGSLTFALGQTSQTFKVIIFDNAINEPNDNKTVILTLSNVTNGILGTPSTATLTIRDNE